MIKDCGYASFSIAINFNFPVFYLNLNHSHLNKLSESHGESEFKRVQLNLIFFQLRNVSLSLIDWSSVYFQFHDQGSAPIIFATFFRSQAIAGIANFHFPFKRCDAGKTRLYRWTHNRLFADLQIWFHFT